MGASITLKNIPDAIYERIKQSARRNHRSMNSEIIACLEQALAPKAVDIETRLANARRLRGQYSGPGVTPDDIASAIDRERQ